MKFVLVLFSMVVAMTTQAADRKIGNVIAVERTVENLYSTCLKNVGGFINEDKGFFSCVVRYGNKGDLSLLQTNVFRLADDNCSVYGDTTKAGALLVTFSTAKKSSSFEASRACLERALNNHGDVKVTVFTIE